MKITGGQLRDLIQESSEWRNTEAQNKIQELLENSNDSSLLFDAIASYDIMREDGGWRASTHLIENYYRKVDKFIVDNQ